MMTQDERLIFLLRDLLAERKEYEDIPVPDSLSEKRRLLRSLMNVRPPVPVREDFLRVQDAYLVDRLAERGMTRLKDLTPVRPGLYLWQGDITTLAVDAIVNAANSQMLGCFVPCHGCIDNAIHTYAGVQLRLECARLMTGQEEEPTGNAKITKAYNLPCRYILHTVGPIISGAVTQANRELLASCYRNSLRLASENDCHTVDFPSISTGIYHFPLDQAAQIAVREITAYLADHPEITRVRMVCFDDRTKAAYEEALEAL